jgi:hypothetical protein
MVSRAATRDWKGVRGASSDEGYAGVAVGGGVARRTFEVLKDRYGEVEEVEVDAEAL